MFFLYLGIFFPTHLFFLLPWAQSNLLESFTRWAGEELCFIPDASRHLLMQRDVSRHGLRNV